MDAVHVWHGIILREKSRENAAVVFAAVHCTTNVALTSLWKAGFTLQ